MKRLFLTLCFPLLTTMVAHAAPTEELVAEIRAKYNAIENASLQSDTIRYAPGDDPMEGTMKRYFRNGELVKVFLSYSMGDHGGAEENYYYDNGQLFFAFISDSSWGFTGKTLSNGESETVDTFNEHRLYFSDGSVIRYLKKSGKSADPNGKALALKNAENQHYNDPEFVAAVRKRAMNAPSVSDPSGLENLLLLE